MNDLQLSDLDFLDKKDRWVVRKICRLSAEPKTATPINHISKKIEKWTIYLARETFAWCFKQNLLTGLGRISVHQLIHHDKNSDFVKHTNDLTIAMDGRNEVQLKDYLKGYYQTDVLIIFKALAKELGLPISQPFPEPDRLPVSVFFKVLHSIAMEQQSLANKCRKALLKDTTHFIKVSALKRTL